MEIFAFPLLDVPFELEVAQVIKVEALPLARKLGRTLLASADNGFDVFFGIEATDESESISNL